jgi:hypothetical protein
MDSLEDPFSSAAGQKKKRRTIGSIITSIGSRT